MNLANHNDVIDHIYASGYFTNHGPLAKKLELALQDYFAIGNAIVVGNESLALIMALAGLDRTGRVGVCAECPDHVLSAVGWAGLEAVRWPAGATTPKDVVALLMVATPGTPPDAGLLSYARSHNHPVLLYQHGHFTRRIVSGCVATITTVGKTSGAPSADCAVILTADDTLAEKYRNIRSSYGARQTVEVRATANGRVSEFQAGMALLFLQNIRNQESLNQGRHLPS